MKLSADTKSLLCAVATGLIGLVGMWRLSYIMMGAYWGVVNGTPAYAFTLLDYALFTFCFVSMLLGIYLPFRWDDRDRREHEKIRAAHPKTEYLPRPIMRDTPWKNTGSNNTGQDTTQ